jgi:hypothetical protein
MVATFCQEAVEGRVSWDLLAGLLRAATWYDELRERGEVRLEVRSGETTAGETYGRCRPP